MPFSRLHAKPKALYKAVVDATTDDERAAAVAALEEYEGSNGSCTSCQRAAWTDGGEEKNKVRGKARRSPWPGNQRCLCVNHATCNGRVGKKGESCVQCQAPST